MKQRQLCLTLAALCFFVLAEGSAPTCPDSTGEAISLLTGQQYTLSVADFTCIDSTDTLVSLEVYSNEPYGPPSRGYLLNYNNNPVGTDYDSRTSITVGSGNSISGSLIFEADYVYPYYNGPFTFNYKYTALAPQEDVGGTCTMYVCVTAAPFSCTSPPDALTVAPTATLTFAATDFNLPTTTDGTPLTVITIPSAVSGLMYNGNAVTGTTLVSLIYGNTLAYSLQYTAGADEGTVTFQYGFGDANGGTTTSTCTMTIDITSGSPPPEMRKMQQQSIAGIGHDGAHEMNVGTTNVQVQTGVLFGCVIGGILVIVLEVVAYFAYRCMRKQTVKTIDTQSSEQPQSASVGTVRALQETTTIEQHV